MKGMERRRARGNKWLDKVRKGNRKGGEKTKRVLEQRQEASRDWVRMEEDRTVKKKKKVKLSGRERVVRERMTSFQKHNEGTATVHAPEAFSPLCTRSSSAPLMSWQSISPPRRLRVAPSAHVGYPGIRCSLPWTVTAPPYLRRSRE